MVATMTVPEPVLSMVEACGQAMLPELPVHDPRPDLQGDHPFWEDLLVRAYLVSDELFITLHGFRCCGAKIQPTPQGYALRPRFAGEGGFWRDEAAWLADRHRWLVPLTKNLLEVLKKPDPLALKEGGGR